MKKLSTVLILLFLGGLFFTRFYNVAYTARFTQDESGFLVRTHQIWVEKKLTLVGQVNEQGKVFGSLSVYFLLPFAVLGNFDPRAMFYGAAFWGVLTALVLFYLGFKVNRKLVIPLALLILFWFPLVQTGRWAWNPNFVPFWVALGLVFYLQKKHWSFLLSGLCFGLAVHCHYYALFIGGFFVTIAAIQSGLKKNFTGGFLILASFVAALLPFMIFDLRHPPGLFFAGASHQSQAIQLSPTFWQDTLDILNYLTQSIWLTIPFIIVSIALLIWDIKNRSLALIFFSPIIFQRLALYIVAPYFFHYYLAVIPFLILWLIYPRKSFFLPFGSLALLTLGGVISIVPLLTQSPVIPDLPTQVAIVDQIKQSLTLEKLVNVNIATLGSDDHDVQSQRYRDILLGRDNIHLDSHDEYFHSDHLFVISTSTEAQVRGDQAPEIHNFQHGPLVDKFPIANTNWVVYHFERNP